MTEKGPRFEKEPRGETGPEFTPSNLCEACSDMNTRCLFLALNLSEEAIGNPDLASMLETFKECGCPNFP